MKNIEAQIAPLIKNMFPTFYQEEGDNFIQFVEAYFEWLESNHQLLTLASNTNFNSGDIVTQGNTTGTVIEVTDNAALVRVNGFDSFRCNINCDEFLPITSSSSGNTLIERQAKLNPIYNARKLFKIRDIDETLDQFIVHFKEKYLKNIEFDTATNKQLLVKNSYDLYRSKGTERSIDLFFRLIYGVKAEVYYPGDDLFRLSDAQWVKPVYIEITNSPRAVELVGQQITGVTSGATAFVEKYIKRRIKGAFVYVLYISNLRGEFINDEVIRAENIYDDSPKVRGSLTGVTVLSGGRLFEVGDIVAFNSVRGDKGLARVAAVSAVTGRVDFLLLDGGYGYTISGNTELSGAELEKRTQSIISERVLTLSNVITSNTIDTITVNAGGSGYDNTDIISVYTPYVNCVAKPTTNSTGGILFVTITNPGSGFFTLNPDVTITNSTGGATLGTSANLVATTKAFDSYFKYFEDLTQRLAEVTYDTASNNQLFNVGDQIFIGNSTVNNAFGVVISNANGALGDANGVLTIGIANNGLFGTGNTIYLRSNTSVTANVASIANTSATAEVMGIPTSANISLNAITGGTIVPADEVFFINSANVETANATVIDTSLGITSGTIRLEGIRGVFPRGGTLRVRSKATTANVADIQLTVGVYNVVNNFTNTASAPIFTTTTGTIANVISVSSGTGASFKVGTLSETETIYLNTDLLAGNGTFTNTATQPYMDIPLNNLEFGFPKNPTGNLSSVVLSCLNFDSFIIGTIASLNQINPGTDYTVNPYVLAYQPYLAGFDLQDYIITIENASGEFISNERILQANTSENAYSIELDDETGIEVGAKVIQGSANGIVHEVTAATNTILVKDVQGIFQVNATPLTTPSNGMVSATVLSVSLESITSTAKGIVKTANNTTLTVKRIQFDNLFVPGSQITGQVSGATANIVSVVEDNTLLPIGLNANIQANVVTANGTVATLEITDSGLGYRDNEDMLFVSEDGLRAGEARAIVEGVGTGSGYYKTSKGTLSSTSKLQDGDFYQEYSYEILTRVPLDRYAEMFRKVMHTAGTRFFGGVLLESESDVVAAYADSSIEIS
jgi:hypothetical protein